MEGIDIYGKIMDHKKYHYGPIEDSETGEMLGWEAIANKVSICNLCKLNDTCQHNFDYECIKANKLIAEGN